MAKIRLADIKTLKDAEKFLRQRFKPFEFSNARHTFPDCDDFSGYQSCLLGAMQRVTWETDKHIAIFLKSEKWPELSSIEKFSCTCRLSCALKTLRLLKCAAIPQKIGLSQFPTEIQDPACFLSWLLISNWGMFGWSDWQDTLRHEWERLDQFRTMEQNARESFYRRFKIVSLVTQKVFEGKLGEFHRYDCRVTFSQGSIYTINLGCMVPPAAEAILELFRTDRRKFTWLNPPKDK